MSTVREVVELAKHGDGRARELVRDAGRTIGTVLAALVNFFNPHRIVMTGGVAQAGVPLIAGIREAVYRRSMPLAARSLEITVSDRPDLSGRLGAALMAIEGYLAGGGWRGKAGAYNLSERIEAGWPIEVQGDPGTVMGLPMEILSPMLRELLTEGG